MPKFALSSKERFMIRTRMLSTPCGTVDEQVRYDKLWDAADIGTIDDLLHASPNRIWNEEEFDGEPKEYDLPFAALRSIKELFSPNPQRPIAYGMSRLARPLIQRIEEIPPASSS